MKVYLDVCCLFRPFDKFLNHRIFLESEAVHTILELCKKDYSLVSSQVIKDEIRMITNPEKRTRVINLLAIADEYVILDDTIVSRARIFKKAGIRTLDALHLASAESVDAAFITSDDKIIKIIDSNKTLCRISVYNPVLWVMGVQNDRN